MESKYLPDFGATNFPPTNRSYLTLSLGSAVSGAGSYSHRSPNISCGIELDPVALVTALVDVISITLGGFSEVIRRLVRACPFLFDLAKQIVQQRARSEAIARRVEPRITERFFHGDEVVQRLLRRSNPACRFHSDGSSRDQIEI